MTSEQAIQSQILVAIGAAFADCLAHGDLDPRSAG